MNNERDADEIETHENEYRPLTSLKAYFGLFLIIQSAFGSAFIYDNPAALQDVMQNSLHINYSQFSSFYSWYSWPNVFLCIVNGYLIDKVLGYRFATVLFTSSVTIGQLLFAIGAFYRVVWLMQIARLLYGIGAEPLQMCDLKYASKWFKNRNSLSLAIAATYCLPSFGGLVNMVVMLPLYETIRGSVDLPSHKCLGLTLLVSTLFGLCSALSAILLAYMDKKQGHVDKAPAVLFKIQTLTQFPVGFWFLCTTCIFYSSCFFPFIGSIKTYYINKYGLTSAMANVCNSLIYLLSGSLSIFVGFFVDKTGKNLIFLVIFLIISISMYSILTFTYLNPFICSALIGVSHTFISASMWPMVSLLIVEDHLATAYGMMQSIQNFGLAMSNMIIGYTIDKNGFFVALSIFVMFLTAALMSAIGLMFNIKPKSLKIN